MNKSKAAASEPIAAEAAAAAEARLDARAFRTGHRNKRA